MPEIYGIRVISHACQGSRNDVFRSFASDRSDQDTSKSQKYKREPDGADEYDVSKQQGWYKQCRTDNEEHRPGRLLQNIWLKVFIVTEHNSDKKRVHPQVSGKHDIVPIDARAGGNLNSLVQACNGQCNRDHRDGAERILLIPGNPDHQQQQKGQEYVKMLFNRQRPPMSPDTGDVVLQKEEIPQHSSRDRAV